MIEIQHVPDASAHISQWELYFSLFLALSFLRRRKEGEEEGEEEGDSLCGDHSYV